MKLILVFLLLVSFTLLHADDGMWLPHQMKDLNLKEKGLLLDPDKMYRSDGTGIMSAVVYLGGGTGEFVSKDGLILTNHHVAYRGIQQASDPEHNYLENGFVAKQRSEEIPVPSYYADVLLSYEEVTKKVLSAVNPDMSFNEMHQALDHRKKEMIAEVETEAPDMRCNITEMYSGNQYFLFRYKRINDIRLVVAPPLDLGNFGGDIDNWMWPRHTCDYSFLRAYVSPENVGTMYNENNIPYHPESVLKISTSGVNQGDLTFVMGYPAKTYRNYSLAEMEQDIDEMKVQIDQRQKDIAFFEAASKNNKAVELKYASRLKSLNNGLKNYQAKLEGFEKARVMVIKENKEKEYSQWISESQDRAKKYGDAISGIKNYINRTNSATAQYAKISWLLNKRYGSVLLETAHTIIRLVTEREKNDMDRDSEYQERNIPRLLVQIRDAERSYDLNTDKEYVTKYLKDVEQLPKENRPQIFMDIIAGIKSGDIETYVDDVYARTKMADPEQRQRMTQYTLADLKKANDPLIELAWKFEEFLSGYREAKKARDMELEQLKKAYIGGLLEMNQGMLAPDANRTLRFTYGDVSGYVPRDGVWYQPLTTLKGVIEKDTGEYPFNVPQKVKDLHANRDFGKYADTKLKDVVTCFLNETNVTGGNSGSPTLNAKGEQVGIIFDMTYESVTGDYYVIPELQRTISVDIRYVLFVTEKFLNAGHIIEEISKK